MGVGIGNCPLPQRCLHHRCLPANALAAPRLEGGRLEITIATNTALFTGLDLGQWIADTLSLWMLPMLPANLRERASASPSP
jgi:hypothetical protein